MEGQFMKIALAADHGGLELKSEIIKYLNNKGIETEDLGTYTEDSVDYPVYGKKCAEYVVSGNADKGIVCCGTGIGISIAANKVKGARCALVTSEYMAEMAAEHNQANVLALGGRTTSIQDAIKFIDKWLETPASTEPRHVRRVELLNEE
jgi:ribose 5-phosphate isomerase B